MTRGFPWLVSVMVGMELLLGYPTAPCASLLWPKHLGPYHTDSSLLRLPLENTSSGRVEPRL